MGLEPAGGAQEAARARWPSGARLGALALALMLASGCLAGGPPLAAAQAFLFYALWVLLPGLALQARLAPERDEALAAGMALALGSVLVGALVFACRASGLWWLLWVWPAATLVAWPLRRQISRAATGAPARREGAAIVAALALCALALLRVPTGIAGPVEGWYLIKKDLIYHVANAAELMAEGALTDPRLAGAPLNYHLLSHGVAAAASAITGESLADLFRWWFMGLFPLSIVLLVFGLARELASSVVAGVLAALVLVLHVDPARGFAERRVASAPLDFLSHLNLGLFLSPPTSLGLGLLAALAVALSRWCAPERRAGAGRAALLALLAAGASAAKGSVMPVAIAAAGFACLVEALRARRIRGSLPGDVARRWLVATAVLFAASLPATLYLSFGPGSYAGAMFRLAPWRTATTTGFGQWLLARLAFLDRAPRWLAGLVATVPWLLGFLGLGALGALAWLGAGRPSLRGLGPWVLGVVLAGLGAAVLLLAPGAQMFFAYDAQLVLAPIAGVGAVTLWSKRRAVAALLAALALPLAAGGANATLRDLSYRATMAERGSELWPRWREGTDWLRANAGRRALVVAGEDAPLWTLFAERRLALADPSVTPEGRAAAWELVDGEWKAGAFARDAFPVLQEACATALRRGDAASLARLREVTGHEGELYLALDALDYRDLSVRPLPRELALDASPALERVFRNDAVAIYRARE